MARRREANSNMASQLLAVQMIPRLGVPGLAAVPREKLASHHDLLRLMFHHQHYNMQGFQGTASACCKIDSKTKRARCRDNTDLMVSWSDSRAGCIEAGSPCLLAKVKHNWEEAHLPIKDRDNDILRVLSKIKDDFDRKSKHGVPEAYLESLKNQTVNLAPADWERRIRADPLTSAAQHLAKINLMKDYLSSEGTRFVLLLKITKKLQV